MVAPVKNVDAYLYQFATVRQLECLEAIDETGSIRAAARKLNINFTVVRQALESVRAKAAMQGYAPEYHLTRPAAPGYVAKGHSTLYRRGEPEPLLQWVKTRADDAERETIVRAMLAELVKDVRGLAPLIAGPPRAHEELMTVYPMGDPHFGMYAWAQESGDNFDLKIARQLTLAAVDRLVALSPPSKLAVILPLGDIFHADDQNNVTPTHKHALDVDSRYAKILQVGIATFKQATLRALERHERVIVRIMRGNHDPHASYALACGLAEYFHAEPRVSVDLSPAWHWYLRFHQVLIGATHGNTVKHKDLGALMAAERPEDWGASRHRYWYTGHIHNQTVTELPGVVCESFRTLAARDAWTASGKYRAGRDMRAIVHHMHDGEIERFRVDALSLTSQEEAVAESCAE